MQSTQQGMPHLEGKNLSILEDQMKHEALAAKKSSLMASQLSDPSLKNVAQTLAQHHQQSFDRLYNYLNSHQ